MPVLRKGKYAVTVDGRIVYINLSMNVANERIRKLKKEKRYKNRNVKKEKQ